MAAEAALNKSLDDLIAEQRTKKDVHKEKKEIRRGNKPSADRAPRRLSDRPQARREAGPGPRNLSITVKNQGGAVTKRRSSGGGVAVVAMREERERQNPEQREAALEGGAKWGHDMYRGPAGGAARRNGGGGGGGSGPRNPTTLGTKLFISNLHFNVTEADIKELFETVGPLVKQKVHYDNSGRSEGTAEVIYAEAGPAERAMRRYNNVQLDGQAMQIELIPQAAPGSLGGGGGGGGAGGPRTLSSGIRISGERGGGGAGGARMVQLTRHFQQAASGPTRVRGRGSVRSGVAAMED